MKMAKFYILPNLVKSLTYGRFVMIDLAELDFQKISFFEING
jgi:hypothetical protein